MNLRLVVIDDEILVRRGIISSVEWERYGFEVAGEATDGKSALELIRRTKPHIVLTDIRMPHMDGLEMIRHIRAEFPETKIFILSVLDDFTTVREALRLGVIDYIPKLSMTPEELLQIVLSVKGKIAVEELATVAADPEVKPAHVEDVADTIADSVTELTGHPSEVCGAWVDNTTSYQIVKIKMDNIQAHASPTGHPIAWQPGRVMASLAGLWDTPLHQGAYNPGAREVPLHQGTHNPGAREASLHQGTHNPGTRIWYADEAGCLWMLVARHEDNLVEALSSWQSQLAAELLITIGISGRFQGQIHLEQAARQAETAIGRSFYYGQDGVYMWEHQGEATHSGSSFMPKEATNAYFTALDSDHETAADEACLQLFPARINEQLPQMVVRDEVYHWVSTVSSYVKERGGNLHSALSGVSPFEELSRLSTYPDIREWCFRLHDVLKSMLSVLHNAHRREITKAIDYAQMHYMLPIRVKEIAQWVHLSENYFSNVFTKETGKTFSQFLQEIRVEQAKRLLKEEEHYWTLIGEKVGFENPKYFTKVFKKYTGVTPKQYAKTRN
jgi:two-component system response regulator YesN